MQTQQCSLDTLIKHKLDIVDQITQCEFEHDMCCNDKSIIACQDELIQHYNSVLADIDNVINRIKKAPSNYSGSN
jgi:hypothetical protein